MVTAGECVECAGELCGGVGGEGELEGLVAALGAGALGWEDVVAGGALEASDGDEVGGRGGARCVDAFDAWLRGVDGGQREGKHGVIQDS